MPSKHITQWIDTGHIWHRRAERRISDELIRETILNPDSERQQRQGEHGGIVWKFEKQWEAQRLRVIAELHKETCYTITAFWMKE